MTAEAAPGMSVKKRLSGLVRAAGKTPSTVKQTHGETRLPTDLTCLMS